MRAGLFDRAYYELQEGRRFPDDRTAALHYLRQGERAGRAPNRVFEPAWYRRSAGIKADAFAHYLRTRAGSVGPQFDVTTYLAASPESASHPGGPLGHYLAHATDESPTHPGTGVDPTTWGRLRACTDERAQEYAEQAALAKTTPDGDEPPIDWATAVAKPRVPGRTSILIPTFRDWRMTERAVVAVLANTAGDVEIVVVDNGSPRSITSILSARFLPEARVRIVRLPRNTNFAGGSNLALVESTGETVVFLNNDTEVLPGWLPPLVDALADPATIAAQPLLRYPDGSIQSAGTLFLGSDAIPIHFLAGHPIEDLPPGPVLRFPAVTAACVAMRASDVLGAHGFDPVYANGMEDVDLCLRLAEKRGGDFAVCLNSTVSHHESKTPGRHAHVEANRREFFSRWDGKLPGADSTPWERAGLTVTGYTGTGEAGRLKQVSRPLLARVARTVASGPTAGLPSLRWAIKIAAHGGPRGDIWGDVAFAEDLARGLRELGQEVVIDRRGAHSRPGSDQLDDVTLHLRGLVPAVAQHGDVTNVLWVISHPDLVEDTELSSEFDLVYSAGPAWAAESARRSGREVRTLLQATNPDRFQPTGPATAGLDVLFVGRTRGVFRPIVRDAIAVGADLAVFGDGWEAFIDPAFIRAEQLPNDDLPAAYRGARVVLNDHWADMAKLGFLSNRLFDAAACGARVISDPVPGLADVFGPTVQTYASVDELRTLLADPGPSESERRTLAERIAAEHSFLARARTLLADVLDVRGVPHDLR